MRPGSQVVGRKKKKGGESSPNDSPPFFFLTPTDASVINDCGLLAYPRCSPKAPVENNQQPSNCLLVDGLAGCDPVPPKSRRLPRSERKPPPKLSLTAVSEPDPITLSTLCQFYLLPLFATTVPISRHLKLDPAKNFSACKNAPRTRIDSTYEQASRPHRPSKTHAFDTIRVYH